LRHLKGFKELLTAAVDDDDDGTPTASTTPYFATQKLPLPFEILKNKGFNFTHYEEH
jgi:hypothetical protein